METVIARLFLHNWQRKSVALITAIILWVFVSNSIQETKTIANVPIRVVNLPADKTILGILPNGILSKRITLTLTGTKGIIEELEPGDLEVLLDASLANNEQWIVQISKKNLVSLNPSIDLANHISSLDHPELVLKLSHLITEKIPIVIKFPFGNAPQGYEYLDIWPSCLTQTLSGPEEEIKILKEKGLKLFFNLHDIPKSELDAIKNGGQGQQNDEISFPVPKKWKQIAIPFQNNQLQEINDPEAQNLHIYFLRKEFLPLRSETPIQVFYPFDESNEINPNNTSLMVGQDIQKRNGITVLTTPLFAREVSRLFVDVVKNYVEIIVVSPTKQQRESFGWNVVFINPQELENKYVTLFLEKSNFEKNVSPSECKKQEDLLRKRFQDYMKRFTLYVKPDQKLHLKGSLEDNLIRIVPYQS